jgi:hypothetical protein
MENNLLKGMVMGFLDNDGNYYEGDRQGNDLEVTQRPSHLHEWLNGEWVFTETTEQIIARLEGALDRHLDDVAKEYRYESIRTMVTYATSEHSTFGNEGRAAVKYRDAVYAYGIQCISDVQAELRPIPTEAELIAELPPFADFLE